MTEKRGMGSFHIGSKGEGIIYVSKKLLNDFPLKNADQVMITIKDSKIIIEKL